MEQSGRRRPEASVNRVTLLGRLGRDSETKYTTGGTPVSRFSVCTTRTWKDKQSGDYQSDSQWTDIVLWNAESLAQHLTKGAKVYIEGRLQTRKYEDKGGVTHYVTEVVAERVIITAWPKAPGGDIAPTENQTGFTHSDDDVPF